MVDKIFHKAFNIKIKRKYVGHLIRRKPGKMGYFSLPKASALPVKMLLKKPAFIECIENSTDTADDTYSKRIAVKYISKKVGYGIFAKEDIPRGVVGIYTGYLKKVDDYSKSRYLFSFTTKALRNVMIDGEKTGNWTGFMNHSFSRKAVNIIVHEYFHKGLPYIVFTAPKKIKKGTQLLYDYGKSYWECLEFTPEKL